MASAEPETLKRLLAEVEMRICELEGQVLQHRDLLQEMHRDGYDLTVMQKLLASFEQKLTDCIEKRDRLRTAIDRPGEV